MFLNQSHGHLCYIYFLCPCRLMLHSRNCMYGAIKKSLGVHHSKEPRLPILSMSVLQTSGCGLYGEAPAAGVPEQVYFLDVELWSRGGDSTVQGSFVIQGLPEACVGERVLGWWESSSIMISCIWGLKIIVLNSRMLQEYLHTSWHPLYRCWCMCGVQCWEPLHCMLARLVTTSVGHIVNYHCFFSWLTCWSCLTCSDSQSPH